MKKIKLLTLLVTALVSFSCSDYLDIVPDNVATIDHAFSDRVTAERYLATIYAYMPHIMNPKYDPAILASDETSTIQEAYKRDNAGFAYYGDRIKNGEQTSNDPIMNYWNGSMGGRGLYVALRDCNIFLENIHKVGPDLSLEERNRWIAEAKFFKAYFHFYLMRLYGPIPLIKENLPVTTDIKDVKVYRNTFDECVDYVVQLCEEAMPDLPTSISDIVNETGRITQPAAAMLKAEALVLAASPLFNGNPEYSKVIDNRGIKLFSETADQSKWKRAAEACKSAIEIAHESGIALYEFANALGWSISDTTALGLSIRGAAVESWNYETIWGKLQAPITNSGEANLLQMGSLPFLKPVEETKSGRDQSVHATFKMAELYYSNKGVPIEEDAAYNYSERYDTVKVGTDHKYYIPKDSITVNLHLYREPRFYACMGFDNGYWFGNGRTKDVGTTTVANELPYILKTKATCLAGNKTGIRYSLSGYYTKKMCSMLTASSEGDGTTTYTAMIIPVMRLADLYLLYAEALNESLDAPNAEVYEYIDKVRERAGLAGVVESWENYSKIPNKPKTKDGMRQIIRQERMIELAFEGKRFYDVRRWKLAQTYFNEPEKGWNTLTGAKNLDFYNVVVIKPLKFDVKQYLWPIKDSELRNNPNLVQNPYWSN